MVGQDSIYTPYMTVYLVISLPKIPCIYRLYKVLANPMYIPFIYGSNQPCVKPNACIFNCFALVKRMKTNEKYTPRSQNTHHSLLLSSIFSIIYTGLS